MLSIIHSSCLNGLEASIIQVEVDLANGLPIMNLVGLPDQSVKESRERVRSAIQNSGFNYPLKRITVNLSPADTKKEGSHFDLPIALGILQSSGQLGEWQGDDTAVLGELSLDGRIQRVNGVLPMILDIQEKGFRQVVLPKGNLEEAALAIGLKIIGVETLRELVTWIQEGTLSQQAQEGKQTFIPGKYPSEDFKDILGQENLKRGMEIAAAGGHNILMIGPPGSGKTMAARRLPSILPSLTYGEAMEITKIYSVAGLLKEKEGIITQRPFRAPHHTTPMVTLVGGGRVPKPGEVSLSHYGVLFLDELPEFSKATLEVLRQPIEEGQVTISRVKGTYTYPSKFMLVAAANPCPCGYYGTYGSKDCTCTPQQIRGYLGKISGPLLDRIDLMIETRPVPFGEMGQGVARETSATIRKRVEAAIKIQRNRYKGLAILNNAQLTPGEIRRFCCLTKEATGIMEQAYRRLNLSGRAYHRTLKVARTIADLAGAEKIEGVHLSEALQYRSLSIFS